jgi:hypothetical protein
MIDETDVVTYRSDNAARDNLRWVAYVVLPNGKYWGVMFTGETEEIAVAKAIELWNSERARFSLIQEPKFNKPEAFAAPISSSNPWAATRTSELPFKDGRGAHFAGKLWMRHIETRKLVRVSANQVDSHLANGYERSSPRSK